MLTLGVTPGEGRGEGGVLRGLGTYRERDDALRGHDPALPLLLADANAIDASHGDARQGVSGRDGDGDGGLELVDVVAGGDLVRGAADLDHEAFVLVIAAAIRVLLRLGPGLHLVQHIRDDQRREVLLHPGVHRNLGLLRPAVQVPRLEEAGYVLEHQVEEVDQEPLHVALRELRIAQREVVPPEVVLDIASTVQIQRMRGRVAQHVEHEFQERADVRG